MLCFAFQQAEQHCKEDLRRITNSHRKRIQYPSQKGIEETIKVWYLAQRGRAGELEKLLARTVKEGEAHRSEVMWNLSLQHLCWTLKVYDLNHPSIWCYHFIHMATTLEVLQLPNWKNRTQGTYHLPLFYLVSSSYYLIWLSFPPSCSALASISPLLPVPHQMLPLPQRHRKGLRQFPLFAPLR